MIAQEKIEKDLKFKPAVDNPTNPGFIIGKRDPNEGTQITGYNKDGTPIEENEPQYGKYPSYTMIPNDITTIEAQPQEDDLMSIYKKYIKPPKENKETENSLRRLAIGEAISKGIAGVGNMFSGKPTQYDSQPMSNTYLKSIEAADERRKRFDALNHDYVNGLYNTEVNQWKYNKAKEDKAADDAEAKRRFDLEHGRRVAADADRLKIAKLKAETNQKRHKEVTAKRLPAALNYETATDSDGASVLVGRNKMDAILSYALKAGVGKGILPLQLSDISLMPQEAKKTALTRVIQESPEVSSFAREKEDEWLSEMENMELSTPKSRINKTTQPTQSGELEVWEP